MQSGTNLDGLRKVSVRHFYTWYYTYFANLAITGRDYGPDERKEVITIIQGSPFQIWPRLMSNWCCMELVKVRSFNFLRDFVFHWYLMIYHFCQPSWSLTFSWWTVTIESSLVKIHQSFWFYLILRWTKYSSQKQSSRVVL